jgi:hypothetical protein
MENVRSVNLRTLGPCHELFIIQKRVYRGATFVSSSGIKVKVILGCD